MCAAGGVLVTDDVLRVGLPVGGVPAAHVGTNGLRLRRGASDQAQLTQIGESLVVFDRVVVRPDQDTVEGPFPIKRIVIPDVVTTDGSSQQKSPFVTTTRLSVADAVVALLSYPRVFVWCPGERLGVEFDRIVTIARQVPVYRCSVERGPMDGELLRAAVQSLEARR